MKIRDITNENDKFLDMLESASSGGTSAGNVASIANPMGAINRRPSLFGYIPGPEEEEQKPRKRSRKRT